MQKISLVFRHFSSNYYSIENVFGILLPSIDAQKVELPYESKGIVNRLKNIRFLLKQKAQLIHITGHDHYLLWYPFKNAILTIHDIEALKRKSGFKKWLFQKLWFDWPIRNAKLVTTISEFSKKEILTLGNYKTPIKVIPNPLTLPLQYEARSFNSRAPRILHIGTKANKNLARLIDAINEIDATLVIVGKINDELNALVKQYGISVENKVNLTKSEICEEYRKCDLLAFVSTYEGFGLPILEAQAVGRPVITSTVASMPEVARKGALLVDPFSVVDIQKGILKIINDKALREELVEQGLENVKRFEAKVIAEQYNQLYKQLENE